MGNLLSCIKKDELIKRKCPYCNYIFSSEKETKNHVKNCIYNSEINLYPITQNTIYLESGF